MDSRSFNNEELVNNTINLAIRFGAMPSGKEANLVNTDIVKCKYEILRRLETKDSE